MWNALFSLPSQLLTALATILGFSLLGDLTAAQQNSLGNFLMLIAQVVETNASQQQVFEGAAANDQLSRMKADIEQLQEQLAMLKNDMEGAPGKPTQ